MCDTFIDISLNRTLFGKNSDREPNEAQQIVRVPQKNREFDTVKATFIEVEHARDTYEVILSKPFQMYGAEMGCNAHGVVIGNEAVFTKIAIDKSNKGLTGMDLVRLALEISKTAKEALENIIYLLEKYGQDACGGYNNQNFYYHNSFLIADAGSGYKLETAGKHWVYSLINGYTAISNGLTITDDYDESSDGIVDFAIKKGWQNKYKPFDFKAAYSQFWMPKLAYCDHRVKASEKLKNHRGSFGVKEAFGILRNHEKNFEVHNAGNKSICMHATGLLCPNSTVGSMVVDLPRFGKPVVWLTGTSTPCLSLFKPFFFGDDILNVENFVSPSSKNDNSYWWRWEKLFRSSNQNYLEANAKMQHYQNKYEEEWLKELDHNTISSIALRQSEEILSELNNLNFSKSGSHYFYDRYRQKLNKQVGL